MKGADASRLGRRGLIVGAGLTLLGCGGKKPPACVSPAGGPGLGYCLVERQHITIPGGVLLPPGHVMLMAADDNNAAIVARDGGGFYALSATCTHQCCTVVLCDGGCAHPLVSPNDCAAPRMAALSTTGAAFFCPCHGSDFAADGRALHGPAMKPLPALALTIAGDDLVVDLSTEVDRAARVRGSPTG